MADKRQTGERCPECGRGAVLVQGWGADWERVTCSNPECDYAEVRQKPYVKP